MTTILEMITIVDQHDKVTGSEERSKARQQGLIHRVVRVLINNSQGQFLIQQRGETRVDHPLKWEWSASGHVLAAEDYAAAANREAGEEVGISTPLKYLGTYYLEERMSSKLTVKRFNGVFTGQYDGPATIDPVEVAAVRWIAPSELSDWITTRPEDFTPSLIQGLDSFGILAKYR